MNWPERKASSELRGSVRPPTTGENRMAPSAWSMSAAGLPRRQSAAVLGSVQPRLLASVAPSCSAACLVTPGFTHPLSAIAWLNRPNAVGEDMLSHTLAPPADSPKMVTLNGLPPNAKLLRFTHRRAAC